MGYISYRPVDLWQAIIFDTKLCGNKPSKLSMEILSVLAMVKPFSDQKPGEIVITFEARKEINDLKQSKQLTIREIEKNIIEQNTDLDIAICRITGDQQECLQYQIKRFGYGNTSNTTSDLVDFLQTKVLDKKYSNTGKILSVFIESCENLDWGKVFNWAKDKEWPYLLAAVSLIIGDEFHFLQFWPFDQERKSIVVTRKEMQKLFVGD